MEKTPVYLNKVKFLKWYLKRTQSVNVANYLFVRNKFPFSINLERRYREIGKGCDFGYIMNHGFLFGLYHLILLYIN